MAMFKHDCPNCGTAGAAFTCMRAYIVEEIAGGKAAKWAILGSCELCNGPVLLEVLAGNIGDLNSLRRDILTYDGVIEIRALPAAQKAEAPEHVPVAIADKFEQAERALHRGDWDAAGMMFRKSLELAVKELDPAGSGDLAPRIAKLPANVGLAEPLVKLAHVVRLGGNGAAHEEDFTEVEAKALHEFTRFFFIYVYTLKHQVAAALPPPKPKP